MSFSQTLGKGQ